jgi:hypothetical protein
MENDSAVVDVAHRPSVPICDKLHAFCNIFMLDQSAGNNTATQSKVIDN